MILLKRDREPERWLRFKQSIKESRRILDEMKKVTDARKRAMDQIRCEFYGGKKPG